MWKMKECPRCNGDIFVDYDEDGMFNHCLQCGYIGNIDSSSLVAERRVITNEDQLASRL